MSDLSTECGSRFRDWRAAIRGCIAARVRVEWESMSGNNSLISAQASLTGLRAVELLVNGLGCQDSRLPGKPVNQPLTVDQAATVLAVKRSRILRLLEAPSIKAAYVAAIAKRRGHAMPRALATIEEIMDDPGDNTPADRGVRLRAAEMLAGIEKGAGQVNVQVNNIRPGYVFRLPPELTAPIIEGSADD